jgi:hypothetical protein
MLHRLQLLQQKLNADDTFKKNAFAEYLTGAITLGFGKEQYTLAIYKGTVLEVSPGAPLTGIDIGVAGPEEGWQQLYGHRNFSRAINPLHGKLSLQGNMIRAIGNINCLAHCCKALCEIQ